MRGRFRRGPSRSRTGARRSRRGFTLLEMIVVITIGGVLASIAILAFSTVRGQLATRSAQNNFMSMHAQARAIAVERGGLASFIVDDTAGEIRVEFDGEVLDRLSLATEFGVTVNSGGGFTQCFTPRGIAQLSGGGSCSTISANQATTVTFTAGNRTSSLEVLPFGQARATAP